MEVALSDEPVDKECDLHFEIAIGRNKGRPGLEQRVAVERVWRDMADKAADPYDREEWLTYIAKRVVSGLIDNPDLLEKGKGSAALVAIGLFGRRVENSDLLNDLQTLMGLADILIPNRKMSLTDKERLLRKQGHFNGLSVKEAKKQIQHTLRKIA